MPSHEGRSWSPRVQSDVFAQYQRDVERAKDVADEVGEVTGRAGPCLLWLVIHSGVEVGAAAERFPGVDLGAERVECRTEPVGGVVAEQQHVRRLIGFDGLD